MSPTSCEFEVGAILASISKTLSEVDDHEELLEVSAVLGVLMLF
jgi:hypothetical protein